MSEQPKPSEQVEAWPYQYDCGNFTLYWNPGNTDYLPDTTKDIDTHSYISSNPRILLWYQNGAYLDISADLSSYVDASGNHFVRNGGDCMLVSKSDPTIYTRLSEIVTICANKNKPPKPTFEFEFKLPKKTIDPSSLESTKLWNRGEGGGTQWAWQAIEDYLHAIKYLSPKENINDDPNKITSGSPTHQLRSGGGCLNFRFGQLLYLNDGSFSVVFNSNHQIPSMVCIKDQEVVDHVTKQQLKFIYRHQLFQKPLPTGHTGCEPSLSPKNKPHKL